MYIYSGEIVNCGLEINQYHVLNPLEIVVVDRGSIGHVGLTYFFKRFSMVMYYLLLTLSGPLPHFIYIHICVFACFDDVAENKITIRPTNLGLHTNIHFE